MNHRNDSLLTRRRRVLRSTPRRGLRIAQIGKDVYDRDVHLFLGQAKSKAMVKGPCLIRTPVHICLRGDAQQSYVAELSDPQRNGRHRGLGLNNWIGTLTTHFKQSEQAAVDALLSLRYTLDDLRNNRSSLTAYVQAMVQNERNAGPPTSNQLSLSWNKLDPDLQRNVPKLKPETTTVPSFIEQLEDRKDIWKRLFSRQPSYRYGRQPYDGLTVDLTSPQISLTPRMDSLVATNSLLVVRNNAPENASNTTPNRGYETQYRSYECNQRTAHHHTIPL